MPRQYIRIPIEERLWKRVTKTDACWLWKGRTSLGYGKISSGYETFLTHRVAWELVAGPIPDGLWVLHTCDCRNCVRNDDEGVYMLNGIAHPRRGHLWLGTREDNKADEVAKGRHARGDTSGARLHPERRPRGDEHFARLHPERLARGKRNGAHTHPERVARGERNGRCTHPESILRGENHPSHLHPERMARGERNAKAKLDRQRVGEIRCRYASGGTTYEDLAKEYAVTARTIERVVRRKSWAHVE